MNDRAITEKLWKGKRKIRKEMKNQEETVEKSEIYRKPIVQKETIYSLRKKSEPYSSL